MYKELIKKYINLLKIDHIKKYAYENNIIISNEEAKIIYHFIKKNYLSILNNDTSSFSVLKSQINPNLYQKIINLYEENKNKYL